MSSSPADADVRPDWFLVAVGDEGEDRSVQVAGAQVRYRVWGPADAPLVVLVHGGAAHGGWWDHVAPQLAEGRRVAAIDLSGHGSSGARDSYDFETWADEVIAVAHAEGSAKPYVVGHSMGGVVALTAAFRHAARLAGAVVVDIPDWVLQGRVPPRPDELPPRRHHPTREEAQRRFRARPDDPARLGFVVDHVASRSVRQTDDGWTWRFDHAVTTHSSFPDGLWGTERCPLVLVLAERGLLTPQDVDELVQLMGAVDTMTITDAGHHVMLDQPLALVDCLGRALGSLGIAAAGPGPA